MEINLRIVLYSLELCTFYWLLMAESDSEEPENIGNMDEVLTESKIMPQIITKVPFYIAEVTYDNDTWATFGNVIREEKTELPPESVKWVPDCEKYHTIIMTDADANPKYPRPERIHWLIVNVLGHFYQRAETLVAYAGPNPKKGTGPHRIVFVIFEQPNKIKFNEPIITMPYDEKRDNFSTIDFAKKYKLGDPNAVNYFTAEKE